MAYKYLMNHSFSTIVIIAHLHISIIVYYFYLAGTFYSHRKGVNIAI